MKKYINKSKDMKTVRFDDGTTVFLRRGQVYESNKKNKFVEEGVIVTEFTPSKKAKEESE